METPKLSLEVAEESESQIGDEEKERIFRGLFPSDEEMEKFIVNLPNYLLNLYFNFNQVSEVHAPVDAIEIVKEVFTDLTKNEAIHSTLRGILAGMLGYIKFIPSDGQYLQLITSKELQFVNEALFIRDWAEKSGFLRKFEGTPFTPSLEEARIGFVFSAIGDMQNHRPQIAVPNMNNISMLKGK